MNFETWSQVALDEQNWLIYILKTDFDERDLKNADPDSKDMDGADELQAPRKLSWLTGNESSDSSPDDHSKTLSDSDTEDSNSESTNEQDAGDAAQGFSPQSSGLSPDSDLEQGHLLAGILNVDHTPVA